MQRDALATAERALGKDNPGTTEPLETPCDNSGSAWSVRGSRHAANQCLGDNQKIRWERPSGLEIPPCATLRGCFSNRANRRRLSHFTRRQKQSAALEAIMESGPSPTAITIWRTSSWLKDDSPRPNHCSWRIRRTWKAGPRPNRFLSTCWSSASSGSTKPGTGRLQTAARENRWLFGGRNSMNWTGGQRAHPDALPMAAMPRPISL